MPRSFRALLPTEVRTCHGRPPAQADALLGVLCLSRAIPAHRRPGFPGLALLCFVRKISKRPSGRHSRAFTHARAGKPLAELTSSLEVFHQDLSSDCTR
jgi:hypothetical protein